MDSDRENESECARLGENDSEGEGGIGMKKSMRWSTAAGRVVVRRRSEQVKVVDARGGQDEDLRERRESMENRRRQREKDDVSVENGDRDRLDSGRATVKGRSE
jgi:hypothetical protein